MKSKYKPGMLVEYQTDGDFPVTTAQIEGVIQTIDGVMYALAGEQKWIEESMITAAYKKVSVKKPATRKPRKAKREVVAVDDSVELN